MISSECSLCFALILNNLGLHPQTPGIGWLSGYTVFTVSDRSQVESCVSSFEQETEAQPEKMTSHSSPIVSSCHALLINGPIQFFGIREDGLVMDDDGLNDLVDVGLAGDLVLAVWCGHERGTKAYGQIVWVHHVFITVLGQTGEGEEACGDGDKEKPYEKRS